MNQKNRRKSLPLKESRFRQEKEVSVSVLEARLKRAVRTKDRLWATIRLAEKLTGKDTTQTERVLTLFAEAEQLAESIHDRRGAAAAIRGAGFCQLRLSNLSAALELLERALPIAEQTGYAECEIQILQDMGTVYMRQGRADLALETLQKCAELAELIGNHRLQASALDQIGITLTDLSQYEEAVEYYTKGLALLDGMGAVRRSGVGRAVRRSGIGRAATVGRAIQREPGLAHDQAIILGNLNITLQFLGRYEEAISTIEQSSQLFHAIQDERNEGLCQGSMGMLYSGIGDYPNALSSMFASAKILERVGDKLNLASVYGNVMEVYMQLGNTEQATDFAEKALAVFEEIGDKSGQAGIFVNLAKQYLNRDHKTQAKRLLNRGLVLSRKIGSKKYETVALTTLATLEMGLGNFDNAKNLLQEALAIASTSGDRDLIIAALLGLGSLFNKQGESDQALSFLERAVTIAGEIHSRRHELEAHQMLAEALEATGDFKRAILHSKLASSIKEEILGPEKQKAITELQIRADIEKSEQETTLLRKEIKSQSREIERIAMALTEKNEVIRNISRRIRKIVKLWSKTTPPPPVRRGGEGAGGGALLAGRAVILWADSTPQLPLRRGGLEEGAKSAIWQFDKLLSELDNNRSPRSRRITLPNEFQLVYGDFLQKLSKHYPALTISERKVCVLLHEGFSTKEMALMLRTTNHTIIKHRRLIRSKMKLEHATNLTTLLAGIV